MNPTENTFMQLARSGRFRLYMLRKLPAAFFSGLRVETLNDDSCSVSVPYKWFTQNPFRSIYFASLAMAAELSTGLQAMARIYKRRPPVSMLVVAMQARYFKKALGRIVFTCDQGAEFEQAIEEAVRSGASTELVVKSVGRDRSGAEVAEFLFTWSFKTKTPKSAAG
ncbi:DUF4442 domain-containing protein [Niabella terrae]